MRPKLTNDERKSLTKRLNSALAAWNQYGNSVEESRLRLAVDMLHCLAELSKFSEMKTFVRDLDPKLLRQLECVKKSFISLAKLELHEGNYAQVYEMVKKAEFPGENNDIIKLWDEAHYMEKESEIGRPLTPLIRFRIRQRFTPPPNICPSNSRPTSSLPLSSKNVLREWMAKNSNNPYPSKSEKEMLAKKGNLTVFQVRTWFANARRRQRKHDVKVSRKEKENGLNNQRMSRTSESQVYFDLPECQAMNLPNLESAAYSPPPAQCEMQLMNRPAYPDLNNKVVTDPVTFKTELEVEDENMHLPSYPEPLSKGNAMLHSTPLQYSWSDLACSSGCYTSQGLATDQIVPEAAESTADFLCTQSDLQMWMPNRYLSMEVCRTPEGASSSAKDNEDMSSTTSSGSAWSDLDDKAMVSLRRTLFQVDDSKEPPPPNTCADMPCLFPWTPMMPAPTAVTMKTSMFTPGSVYSSHYSLPSQSLYPLSFQSYSGPVPLPIPSPPSIHTQPPQLPWTNPEGGMHSHPWMTSTPCNMSSLMNAPSPANVTPPWFITPSQYPHEEISKKSQEKEVAQALLNLSHRKHFK